MRGQLMRGAACAALMAMAFAATAVAQEADPPADANTSATISAGQPVNGRIDPTGDSDWYRLNVQQGQRYVITLDAAPGDDEGAVDTYLTLHNAQGAEIASNDDSAGTLNSRLAYAPQADGHIFVDARAFADNGTGAYTLQVEAGPAPADDVGNDASTRATLAAGRAVNGAIEIEGDADWYRLNVRTGNAYRITLNTAGGTAEGLADPLLQIFDAEGNQLAYNDDGDEGLNSALDFVPQRSGRVYVVAGAFNDAYAGAYTLQAESRRLPRDSARGDTSSYARLTMGRTVTSQLDYPGDRDWYRMRLEGGQTYRFALNSAGEENALGDPLLRIYDGRGDEQAMDDDGGGNLNSMLEFTAPSSGTYFIEARGFTDDAQGGYALTASAGDIAADASTDMRLDAEGDYREGALAPAGDRDWYRMTLAAGQSVRVGLSAAGNEGLDPMLVLYGPNSQEVARDDDGGEGLNSWLEFTATEAGDYFVEARGFTDEAQGRYVINVAPGEIPDNVETTEALNPSGDPRTSRIGAAGDVDWFAIELVEGRPYRFTVEGAGEEGALADPMITLYGPDSEEVASNDDGGAGLNAYLSYASPTGGPHFVAVSGVGEGTGTYSVRAVDTETPGHIYTDEALDAANGDERVNRIEMPGDLDYYRVDLEQGARYVIEVRANGRHPLGNPHVVLMDAENNRVAFDADTGAGRNARLSFRARETGAYFVQASGAGGTTGSYQVSIVRR